MTSDLLLSANVSWDLADFYPSVPGFSWLPFILWSFLCDASLCDRTTDSKVDLTLSLFPIVINNRWASKTEFFFFLEHDITVNLLRCG